MMKLCTNLFTFSFKMLLVAIVVFSLTVFLGDKYLNLSPTIEHNLPCCVRVITKDSSGSGVVYINGDKQFVWTCAHVVSSHVQNSVAIDLCSKTFTVHRGTEDVLVESKIFSKKDEDIGNVKIWAKIIRFSAAEDLAVLEMYSNNMFTRSVKFPADPEYTLKPGFKVYHIGSMNGKYGYNSIAEGVSGLNGIRLGDHLVYDRFSTPVQPGSSGGAMFDRESGRCIGIVSQSLDKTSCNQCFTVPWSRMVAFAQKLHCTWALCPHPVPSSYLDNFTEENYAILPPMLLNQKIN